MGNPLNVAAEFIMRGFVVGWSRDWRIYIDERVAGIQRRRIQNPESDESKVSATPDLPDLRAPALCRGSVSWCGG
jgi:dipeptidyl aminopeptidase/acylaminoacyl peptidase